MNQMWAANVRVECICELYCPSSAYNIFFDLSTHYLVAVPSLLESHDQLVLRNKQLSKQSLVLHARARAHTHKLSKKFLVLYTQTNM